MGGSYFADPNIKLMPGSIPGTTGKDNCKAFNDLMLSYYFFSYRFWYVR
jgi:hypothetical protein